MPAWEGGETSRRRKEVHYEGKNYTEVTKTSDGWEDHDPRASAEGNPAAGIAIDRIIGHCVYDHESVRYPEQTEG